MLVYNESYDKLWLINNNCVNQQFSDAVLSRYQISSNIDECLHGLASDPLLAVAVSRHHSQNYPPIPAYKMTCFDESQTIRSYFISMYIRNDQPYFPAIAYLTERAFEGGLFVKWTKDEQITNVKPEILVLTPLGIEHLGGALFGFVLIMMSSVWAFVAELLTYKRARLENPRLFWVLMEKLINSERYLLNVVPKVREENYEENKGIE